MQWDKNSVREGMFVTSTKGERIGKVIRRDDETFVAEKGTLFPKDYELRYDHITGVDGGAISYSLIDLVQREDLALVPREDLARREDLVRREVRPSRRDTVETTAATAPAKVAAPRTPLAATELTDSEVRIPLMEEELEIEKVPRESGHVRIHKEVRTEERHFTVPVRREEIVIEHVTAFAGGAGTGEPGAFEERTVDIPLYEEEILVTKRPVLREEIVVRTVAHSVEKEASATVRHEEADVEDTRKNPPDSEPKPGGGGYGAPGSR